MVRYSIIVQVLIGFKFKDNPTINPDELMDKTSDLINKLFPHKKDNTKNTVFKHQAYRESHQITWDISGEFDPTSKQLLECNSEREVIQKHYESVLSSFLKQYNAEYKVFVCGYKDSLIHKKLS